MKEYGEGAELLENPLVKRWAERRKRIADLLRSAGVNPDSQEGKELAGVVDELLEEPIRIPTPSSN